MGVALRRSSTFSLVRSLDVEREVQLEDVDPRFAKEAELPVLGVRRHERPYLLLRQAA